MRISVESVTAAEKAYEVMRAGWQHDLPDIPPVRRADFVAAWQHPRPDLEVARFLGLLDGVAVGYLELQLPRHDNLDHAMIELTVRPEHRRRGVGRALLETAAGQARALGRRRLTAQTVGRHPDGAAFATATGARPVLEQLRSRLVPDPADRPRRDAMLADAWRHADGYRLIQWTGVPPDEVIDDVAYLEGRLLSDAPTGDLGWEPHRMDADRVRRTELARIARGRTSWHTGAMQDDRLVAWTSIVGHDAQPGHAWQQVTLVAPEHRGRRLGLLVKLANLTYVGELRPGPMAIDTFNAPTNAHMIRINEAIGFRVVESWTHWQRTA